MRVLCYADGLGGRTVVFRHFTVASVVICLTCANYAAGNSREGLGLGLDKLRWGMTISEVKAAYPSWKTGSDSVRASKYSFDGCSFDVFPEFTGGKFDTVILETFDGSASCNLQIRRELMARYGTPVPAETFEQGTTIRLEWKSNNTLVSFMRNSNFLHIAFEQAVGSPHHVISDPVSTFGNQSGALNH
jgi:hypothetical protein